MGGTGLPAAVAGGKKNKAIWLLDNIFGIIGFGEEDSK